MASPGPGRLGPYELVSLLGKGGMGEVWKARDTRLNRDVAIKICAQQFTDRFEREARAIGALNHKNICTLYDVGPNFLVMELIEGPTLAERIAQGPIPLDEALVIAKQIAEALEAADEKAIVHRDLKPANVKIKPDGSVKVLDFGLAKAASEEVELTSDSPTMMPGTQVGMILGTAGYMSPEQARGQKADKRADIWAFGVVLYEMVTGKRLFDGATMTDSLAAILRAEPDLTQVPEKIRRLLARCLEKDPKTRLRDIGDWGLLLESEPSATAPSRSRLSKTSWAMAVAVPTAIAAALAFVYFREKPPEMPVARSTILPPEKTTFGFNSPPRGAPALSPDGRRLVFGARSDDGVSRLWIRSLDSMTAQPLAGTEGATFAYPFWSPDGRYIGFSADGKLKKVDVSGGPAVTLADAPFFRGASWSSQGVIVFAPNVTVPLQRIPAAGGTPAPATAFDPSTKDNTHRWPWFLPDGRHFLYASGVTNTDEIDIYAGSLDSRENRLVAKARTNALYASGYLLFLREKTLMAQPFNTALLTTTGDAIPVAEQIDDAGVARGSFTASANGTLVFQSGVAAGQTLTWLDRTGRRLATVGDSGLLGRTFLAPDDKRAVVSVYDPASRNYDLWIYDLVRNLRSRFTFDPADEYQAVWSHDGSQLVFSSKRRGHFDLYRKLANSAGAEELLYADELDKFPTSWSADGRFVLYDTSGDKKTGNDLWVLPLEGERKPFPFLKTAFNELYPQFSPDGRWVVYQSNESGRAEIYISPFPGAGGKRQVSVAGGSIPRWRGDGKEIYYASPEGQLMSAETSIKANDVEIGSVKALFGPLPVGRLGLIYDVAPDGQRFLVNMPNEQASPEPLTLVQNWTAGLKK